jgi:methionyl-tRNA formyltransferase
MKKQKIVFIGGLTNGKIVLDYLLSNIHVDVPLILTYPKNHKIPRYSELNAPNHKVTFKYHLDGDAILDEISLIEPDFIFVAGWSNMLSAELLAIPKSGTIGFHPSKLPNDRGRSVLAWQIEDGYRETALSMFYYNNLPDCGDIIAQERIRIEYNDYIEDVLCKVDQATYNLMKAYFPLLRRATAPRRQQDINEGNFRRLRTDKDSMLNWDTNVEVIYNKIRAISRPYPGAIGAIGGVSYRIWRAIPCNAPSKLENANAGHHYIDNSQPIVKCRDGCIKILDYETL